MRAQEFSPSSEPQRGPFHRTHGLGALPTGALRGLTQGSPSAKSDCTAQNARRPAPQGPKGNAQKCVALGLPALLGSLCLAPAAAQSLGPSGAQLLHRTGESIQLQSGGTATLGSNSIVTGLIAEDGSVLALYTYDSPGWLYIRDGAPSSISNTAILAEGYVGPQGGLPTGAGPVGAFGNANLSVDGSKVVARVQLPGRQAIFAGPVGNLSLVAEAKGGTSPGTPAPGTQGSVFAGFGLFSDTTPQGEVLILARLTGGNVTSSANDDAYYLHTPTGLELIAREGDPSPLGAAFRSFDSAAVARLNSTGSAAFRARVDAFTGPANLQFTEDEAWFLRAPGGTPQILIREGAASPYPGYLIGSPVGAWPEAVAASGLNSKGELLVSTPIYGAVLGDISRALIVASPNGSRGVAQEGAPIPGIPGATFSLFSISGMALNDAGQVLFIARIGGLPAGLDSGLFLAEPTGLIRLLVLEGNFAPGTGNGRFGDLFGEFPAVALNNAGVALVRTKVEGGAFPGRALYRYDESVGLQPIALAGESFPQMPAGVAPLSDVNFQPAGTGSGRTWALNESGTVSFGASFGPAFTGSTATFRLPTGTLFINPPTLSTSAGGTAQIRIHLGSKQAGRTYLTLASQSGSTPGLPLGLVTLQLNPDSLTTAALQGVNTPPWGQTLGVLNDAGQATATLTLPAGLTALTGLQITFATLAIEISGIPFVAAASTPAQLFLVP